MERVKGMKINSEFVRAMLPAAVEAIGRQHGFLVEWAIAKAGQECGWNVNNCLVTRANNCLGIKAGVFFEESGKWATFDVPLIWIGDSTADGRDDGRVPWRRFDSLAQCFGEFVRMINDREPYHPLRDKTAGLYEELLAKVNGALGQLRAETVAAFENVYTDNLKGHAEAILGGIHEVKRLLEAEHICDEKGRLGAGESEKFWMQRTGLKGRNTEGI